MRIFNNEREEYDRIEFIQFGTFCEIEKIGSGSYATVYTAKHGIDNCLISEQEQVVLKEFKNFDGKTELLITEVNIHSNISYCMQHICKSYVLKVILI